MTMVKTAIALLIAAMMLVACDGERQVVRETPPTPTPYVPQYTSTEVIGIVHNKMTQECGSRSYLAHFRDGYSAYTTSTTRVWTVTWRIRSGDEVVSLQWEFHEDSGIVAQLSPNLGRYCNR